MQTCMPLGLMRSKAPVTLLTNWMTLLKLSSPILQEPSMRKTRSALAPLHTVVQKRDVKIKAEPRMIYNRTQMSKLSPPSSAGGTVAGAGGVGGSVGTSVGLTTARQKQSHMHKTESGTLTYKLWLARGNLEASRCFPRRARTSSSHTLSLNWHRGCYHTCPLLFADSRSLQVWGLGVHCGVVKNVRGQAIEAVTTLRASDSDLLSSALGG